MPGHKGGKIQPIQDLFQLDVTEVEGLDDLHHPTGMIAEVNHYISKVYDSGYSTMLVNGSTGGILSAIMGSVPREGHVLIARNCHKAVYNSVVLNRNFIDFVMPDFIEGCGFFGAIDPVKVQEKLDHCTEKVEALIMTSPTFEGVVSDITRIASIVHSYGAILIVDEAHGAHFTYSDQLPKSALECGADIVIQSAHKTLPCMTQTSLLHLSKEALASGRIDVPSIQKQLAVFQTSSPSYVLMTSIEKGLEYMDHHRHELDVTIQGIQAYLASYHCQFGRWLFSMIDASAKFDPTRLTFVIQNHPMSGWELNRILRKEFSIQVEMAGMKHIVAISTLADSIEEIRYLGEAINKILSRMTTIEEDDVFFNVQALFKNPSEQFNQIAVSYEIIGKSVKLKDALGYRSNAFIIPYPPGIPLIVPGEVFSEEKIKYIEDLLENEMEVYGIMKGEVTVFS